MFSKNHWRALVAIVLIAGLTKVESVSALGTPQIVGVDPWGSASVGTTITIHAQVAWDADFRSMRICLDDWCQEEATPDFSKSFNTSGLNAGGHRIYAQAAKVNEGWDTATTSQVVGYELTANQPPPPPPAQEASKGPSASISFNPSSQVSGGSVDINVSTSSVPGAVTVDVSCGGVSKAETSESNFTSTWRNTESCGSGEWVQVCTRAQNDPNWTNTTCMSKNYSFSAPQQVQPIPSIEFWADSTSIGIGKCTTLHWRTGNAQRVDIDGEIVNANGEKNVCPSVTKKYTLTAQNGGGNSYANVKVVVSTSPAPPISDPSSHFNEGDVINIGGRIYVIVVDGQGNRFKRWIPNPDSLDDLGISRSMVNNKGFSDAELELISNGGDIPDTNRDSSGFQDFKEEYFPNLPPIPHGEQPNQQSGQGLPEGVFDPHAPGVCPGWETRLWIGAYARTTNRGGGLVLRNGPSTSEPKAGEMYSGQKFTIIGGPVCRDGFTWWNIQGDMGTGWSAEAGEDNGKTYWWIAPMTDPPTSPPPQAESQNAVEDVGEQRIQGTLLSQCPSPTPEEEKTWFEKLFEVQASDNRFEEGQCTWYVYDQRPDVKDWIPDSGAYAHTWDNSASSSNLSVDHNPREGDIAVWEQSCGGPYSKSGHVAYVTKVFEKNDEQWIEVNEYNWNGDLERHEGSEYRVREENCMKFIHEPSNNSQNAEEQVNNQAGSDKKSLLQRIKDWFDNLFK